LDYRPSTFRYWSNEVESREMWAKDHWFYVYRPQSGDLIVDVGAGKGGHNYIFFRRRASREGHRNRGASRNIPLSSAVL
jgi:hypothetical protein